MRQKYHPYQIWEGYLNGMYEPCKEGRDERVKAAASFLTDYNALFDAMCRVTDEWSNETEHVLSDMSINHRAWLGQSACNISLGIKEDETREAWGLLNEEQRRLANRCADRADSRWRCMMENGMVEQMSFDDLMEAI